MKKLSKGQLILYAFAGFGPNLLGTILGVYMINAVIIEGFGAEAPYWTFANKTLVVTAVFSVLVLIAKLLDGITDIPLAGWTDSLKSKWGKRRPAMLIGFIPMVLSYMLYCLIPINEEHNILNTIYYGVLLSIFFTAYTLTFVTYYGTYSEVTSSPEERILLSNWKAFFDTIQYSVSYALIPVFISLKINIRTVCLISSPFFLTLVLVFFLLKEKSTLPEDIAKEKRERENKPDSIPQEEDVGFFESIKLTAKNKGFMIWLAVMAAFFFGLQLFLAGQNVLASGSMGLLGWQIAVINTSAFAPVPLMLWIYRKVMKKKGFRFAFQTALFSFALAMITFSVAYVEWIPSVWARLIIGAIGGTIGSYGIGAFFSAPYVIPSQMAAEELKATGKSHPSMYFAMQGFFNAIVAAISTSVVWLNIRELTVDGEVFFGVHLMPYIVAAACALSIILAFFLPKSFSRLGREKDVNLSE
ncbi:MAG: MFS transporter [Candidatus Lokiarchaeota archaeon]|nr:MFS transporter [Candidatus Lokiarchaeota archaeon]